MAPAKPTQMFATAQLTTERLSKASVFSASSFSSQTSFSLVFRLFGGSALGEGGRKGKAVGEDASGSLV